MIVTYDNQNIFIVQATAFGSGGSVTKQKRFVKQPPGEIDVREELSHSRREPFLRPSKRSSSSWSCGRLRSAASPAQCPRDQC
jgi:hypothetical protein